jgi:hypothetical protein
MSLGTEVKVPVRIRLCCLGVGDCSGDAKGEILDLLREDVAVIRMELLYQKEKLMLMLKLALSLVLGLWNVHSTRVWI